MGFSGVAVALTGKRKQPAVSVRTNLQNDNYGSLGRCTKIYLVRDNPKLDDDKQDWNGNR